MKKICICLLCTIITLMFTNVYAISIVQAGDDVVQKGNYDSIRFVAGNKVINKANIDGLSFVAGNEIVLEGSAPYGFYAGNLITINEKISKDLFVAGNSVTLGSDAEINRDAYIFGSSVKINTNIGRDLRVAGTSIDLSGVKIGGDAYIEADEIICDEFTTINGKLTYREDTKITGLNSATIGSVEVAKINEEIVKISIFDKVKTFVVSTISSFISLVVLFYIIPKSKDNMNKIKISANYIIKNSLIGLAILITTPIISLIALFTGILTPIALITLLVYGIGIYLSSLLVYYIVGNLIINKVLKKENMYLSIICGILVVKLVKIIPVIGGIVSFVSLMFGLGLIFKFIETKDKK